MLTTFTLTLAMLSPAPAAPATVAATPVVHCQVPCGIYGDHLRVELLVEHAATIEKAMGEIERLGAEDPKNFNQIVRWVTTKDAHAQEVQDQMGDYWLAQRIKAPQEGGDEATKKYMTQLVAAHGIMTSAMKCKQTTDTANVTAMRRSLEALKGAYFSKEDLEHIRGHGGAEKADDDHGHEHDEKGGH